MTLDELDAVAAAPAHHTAGAACSTSSSFANFVRRDADGRVLLASRGLDLASDGPLVLWSEPLPPHTLENVGKSVIHAVVVELKDSGD